jgi:hypothetical protein
VRSPIARATAIEIVLIALGILLSCVVRYFHYGLRASAAEYGIIAVGTSVTLMVVVESLFSRVYRPL